MPIYKMEGKKDGLQKYRVRVNYTDSSGKARQTDRVAYGKEMAKELERELSRDMKTTSFSRLTLHQLYNEYIDVKQYEVRENTMRTIQGRLEPYVISELGDYEISNLNVALLQKWKQTIEERRNKKNPSKKLSLILKQNIYGAFRTLLNYAVRMEYISKNPLIAVGNFKNPYELKREMKFYTPEEFKRFIHAAEDAAISSERQSGNTYEWNFHAFFSIAFYTGMRKGEILALKWSDIEENIIHVRRSITQKLNGEDKETPPKNKTSIRDLQMPVNLINILREHKKRHEQMNGFNDNFRICGGVRCIRSTTIDQRNQCYSNTAGLKRIRLHDFRHSHASLLANNGINIQEIARRLGHANVEITWNVYSHLYPHEEEKAVEILNKI